MSYQILFENAIKSYNEGNLENAEAISRELLQVMPDEPQIKKMLGFIAFDKELYDQAADIFFNLLSVDSHDFEIMFKLAQTLEAQGRFSEAISYYDNIIANNPSDSQAYYGKGVSLQSMGDLAASKVAYEMSLSLNNDNWQAILGLASLEGENPEKAKELLSKAQAKSPDNPFIMYHLALILKEEAKFQEALDLMEKVSIIYPHPKMMATLGMLYDLQGNEVSALEIYNEALIDSPHDSIIANLKAEILVKNGDYKGAKEILLTIIEYNKNDLDSYANLGAIAHKQGLILEAIEYYRKAIAINPEAAEVLLNLAFILYEQEELDEAIGMFFNVLRINKNTANLEKGLHMALLDYIKVDKENALKLAHLWQKTAPDSELAKEIIAKQ